MKALILAAGKGTRLQSEKFNLPKVLREINGRPIISYVLENIDFLRPEDIVLVIGYKGEQVEENCGSNFVYAWQKEQKGTGHAVMCAEECFADYDGDVIILYGDMPLFKAETYKSIIEKHQETGADLTLLTCIVDNPPAYGRIIRDVDGKVMDIVEDKDANDEQKAIRELNVGIYVAKSRALFESLHKINNNNAQGEYYLTDVPRILIDEGKKVESFTIYSETEFMGVNTLEDLEFCANVLNGR